MLLLGNHTRRSLLKSDSNIKLLLLSRRTIMTMTTVSSFLTTNTAPTPTTTMVKQKSVFKAHQYQHRNQSEEQDRRWNSSSSSSSRSSISSSSINAGTTKTSEESSPSSSSSSSSSSPCHHHRQRHHHRHRSLLHPKIPPRKIVSGIGSIYKPPDFFLGIHKNNNNNHDNNLASNSSLFLPIDDTIVEKSIGSCVKIDEHHEGEEETMILTSDDNNSNNNSSSRRRRGGGGDSMSDTGMSICFLGTGAGSPGCYRSTTSTLVRMGGNGGSGTYSYLFDVGEGCQRQLQFVRGTQGTLQNIHSIFITHLHGDHLFGLPGLLLSLQSSYLSTNIQEQQQDQQQKNNNNEDTTTTRTNANTNTKNNNNNNHRKQKQPTVKIYGPPGLFNYIASSITLSCTKLHILNVKVYELIGSRIRNTGPTNKNKNQQHQGRRRNSNNNNIRKDPFYSDYNEYNYYGGNIERILIPCDDNDDRRRIWTIQDLEPITKENILILGKRRKITKKRSSLSTEGQGQDDNDHDQPRMRIQAAEVDHLPGVTTFGYVLTEDTPPCNLDVTKARALGVSYKDNKYDLLRYGFPVMADMTDMDNTNKKQEKKNDKAKQPTNAGNNNSNSNSGINKEEIEAEVVEEEEKERIVYPHEVVKSTSTKKARKFAFIGDNRGWSPEMTEIARHSDVLIHEATLLEQDYTRGHSTAAMAGRNGANCDAKLLILNHISPKMEDKLSEIVKEAYDSAIATTTNTTTTSTSSSLLSGSNRTTTNKRNKPSILMSFDFMQVTVPWLGFGSNDVEYNNKNSNKIEKASQLLAQEYQPASAESFLGKNASSDNNNKTGTASISMNSNTGTSANNDAILSTFVSTTDTTSIRRDSNTKETTEHPLRHSNNIIPEDWARDIFATPKSK